jgi:dTDP-4-dehydrorhamnose 3,5-epimerase
MTEHACHLRAHDRSSRFLSLRALAVLDLPSSVHSPDARLPVGVALRELPRWDDCVQEATQIYRADWELNLAPIQWNLVASKPNALRGVHVHTDHWDYLHIMNGEMLLGLHDLRPWSPTYRLAAQLRLTSDRPTGIAIPPGVAHGFYFAVLTTYFYALSHYWMPSDDLGCRWDDPELGIFWPTSDPLLSPRDAMAQSYRALAKELASREITRS